MAKPGEVNQSGAGGIIWAVLAFASFSTTDAIVKLASETLPVMQVTFFVSLASLVPVLGLFAAEGGLRNAWPEVPGLVLLRALLMGLATLLAFTAFSLLPLADAYALIFTLPLWATLLSAVFASERVGVRRGGAVVVGFLGVLVMVRPGEPATLEFGHLAAAGGALTAALAFIVTRHIGGRARGGVQLVAVILALILVAAPSLTVGVAPIPFALAGLLALAGVFLACAHFCVWRALRLSEASLVTPFQYTQMLWAVVYGWLLFGDWPSVTTLVGGAIVVGSGLYIVHRERRVHAR